MTDRMSDCPLCPLQADLAEVQEANARLRAALTAATAELDASSAALVAAELTILQLRRGGP